MLCYPLQPYIYETEPGSDIAQFPHTSRVKDFASNLPFSSPSDASLCGTIMSADGNFQYGMFSGLYRMHPPSTIVDLDATAHTATTLSKMLFYDGSYVLVLQINYSDWKKGQRPVWRVAKVRGFKPHDADNTTGVDLWTYKSKGKRKSTWKIPTVHVLYLKTDVEHDLIDYSKFDEYVSCRKIFPLITESESKHLDQTGDDAAKNFLLNTKADIVRSSLQKIDDKRRDRIFQGVITKAITPLITSESVANYGRKVPDSTHQISDASTALSTRVRYRRTR